MNESTIIVLISVAVNIGVVAFSYGKLYQKVVDLCRRVGKTEGKVDTLTEWVYHQTKK